MREMTYGIEVREGRTGINVPTTSGKGMMGCSTECSALPLRYIVYIGIGKVQR